MTSVDKHLSLDKLAGGIRETYETVIPKGYRWCLSIVLLEVSLGR